MRLTAWHAGYNTNASYSIIHKMKDTKSAEQNAISRDIKTIGSQRLVCVDALRGFDMLWIIGGAEVLISFSKASGIGFLSNIEVNFDHSWGQFHFYDLI